MHRHILERALSLKAQLLTIAGIQKRGFFIPYDYPASTHAVVPAYAEVEALFYKLRPEVEAFIFEIANHVQRFKSFRASSGDPDWQQGMFPPLDGAATYTMIRKLAPRRIIEVGSGNSTYFLVRAARDNGDTTSITCIDPAPRRDIQGLGVEIIPRILKMQDIDRAEMLGPGDVLFLDSSHIMLPSMDVDILFNTIFPRLARGVVVHLHDIFLPDGYPPHWRWRYYNEQNALIGWLLSGFFEVIYPGHYATSRCRVTMEACLAAFAPFSQHASGSIWLRRS